MDKTRTFTGSKVLEEGLAIWKDLRFFSDRGRLNPVKLEFSLMLLHHFGASEETLLGQICGLELGENLSFVVYGQYVGTDTITKIEISNDFLEVKQNKVSLRSGEKFKLLLTLTKTEAFICSEHHSEVKNLECGFHLSGKGKRQTYE